MELEPEERKDLEGISESLVGISKSMSRFNKAISRFNKVMIFYCGVFTGILIGSSPYLLPSCSNNQSNMPYHNKDKGAIYNLDKSVYDSDDTHLERKGKALEKNL